MSRASIATSASSWLHRHRRSRLALLLSAPMLWLVVAYLGSLGVMFVSAFWSTDSFTGALVKHFTTNNFHILITESVYRTIAIRSLVVASLVTIVDAILAMPIAFFMAKVLSPRMRRIMVAVVLLPLWASYLVKAYAWRTIFSDGGVLAWLASPFKVHTPGFGLGATTVVLAYLWLPYMILPIFAGLERLPDSLLDASSDLGASAWRTFRSVVLPITYPAFIAGSIFTFSLSMGDYISVKIVGGKTQLFANVVYDNIGTAGNLPFAAAASMVPVITIVAYLLLVRRSGALNNL
jgi:putative spermidine/putrescine transport system permease protein